MIPNLILASKSFIRRKILEDAKVPFEYKDSRLDEEMVKHSLRAEGLSPAEQAHELAFLKAQKVSIGRPEFVLGADQILSLDGKAYDKASNMIEAKERLKEFRGKTHRLETSIVIVQNSKLIWRYDCAPKLKMRDFSDEFLDYYLEEAGDEILSSVGCYQLENIGAQLFDKIEGDYFSILGLPLIETMAFLRLHKMVK